MEARIKKELHFDNIEVVDGRPGIFLVEMNDIEIFHNKKEQVKYPDEVDVIERLRKVL